MNLKKSRDRPDPGSCSPNPRNLSVAGKRETSRRKVHLGRHMGFLAFAWTVIVGVSLAWNLREQREGTLEAARIQARAELERDMLYREWNAMHGGVYALVTDRTQPNPDLRMPDRDIVTPAGEVLTKINPAYMTRQVFELEAELTGTQGHVTSLNPVRPENAADPWETKALMAFENGVAEYDSVEVFRGEYYLRLMRPLVTEKGCLKFHAAQGYVEGDIHGGISVSIPLEPHYAAGHAGMVSIATWHGTIWLLVLGGIGFSYRTMRNHIRERNRVEEIAEAARTISAQAREMVHSASEFNDALFESVPVGVVLIDRDKRIRRVNEAALRLMGDRPAADVLDQPCHECLCPAQEGACPIWDCGKEVENSERILLGHEGKQIPILKTVATVTLDGEEMLLEAFVDITDRKAAEERERRATEKLNQYAHELELNNETLEETKRLAEAATKSKSEFLANMSHEIRTPMTAILGFAENLLDPELSVSERMEFSSTILRNGRQLLVLINDILDLSKIEAGKLEVERISCSPYRIVADVMDLMGDRAREKGLQLKAESAGAIPEVICSDPARLRQILVNLVGNAVKFTETGVIRIGMQLVHETDGPLLQYDVADTGVGMSQEQAADVFGAFAQADPSTTRKYGGSGLGLTISKRLSRMLGGDLLLMETREGAGSRFRATVATGSLDGVRMLEQPPRELMKQKFSAMVSAPIRISELNCRILLAEDGDDNQYFISSLLKKVGAEVAVASNGEGAVEMALAATEDGFDFDVILMDMQMPVMDGYEAARLLRREGCTVPIIALTAHAMKGDREKCLAAGCDDYVSKPIDRAELLGAVSRWLSASAVLPDPTGPSQDADIIAAKESKCESPRASDVLLSERADDPDIAALIERFVGRLPERVAALEKALSEEDTEALGTLAHQLSGAAGSYGFPPITEVAKRLEEGAKTQQNLETLGTELQVLTDLCRRARPIARTSP